MCKAKRVAALELSFFRAWDAYGVPSHEAYGAVRGARATAVMLGNPPHWIRGGGLIYARSHTCPHLTRAGRFFLSEPRREEGQTDFVCLNTRVIPLKLPAYSLNLCLFIQLHLYKRNQSGLKPLHTAPNLRKLSASMNVSTSLEKRDYSISS